MKNSCSDRIKLKDRRHQRKFYSRPVRHPLCYCTLYSLSFTIRKMTVAPLVGQQAQQVWKVFVGENGKKGDNQRNLSCLPAPSLKQKNLWREVCLWRLWTRLSGAARAGSRRWDVQARSVGHTGELKHASLILFLVSSLTANEIIRIHVYIVITYTFLRLCGADPTCFSSTHLPLHPPPNGHQSVTFFAHLLIVVQAGLPVHGKTKWFISSLHFYPICTTSTRGSLEKYYYSNWSQVSLSKSTQYCVKAIQPNILIHLTSFPVLLLKRKKSFEIRELMKLLSTQ